MILPDVNVLVYAHHQDSAHHAGYRRWWEGVVNGRSTFALADSVLAGFLRVVTHRRFFASPMPMRAALHAATAMRSRPNCLVVKPGSRHWDIFEDLCLRAGVNGNLVPDAYLAALAIEHGTELATADRGFARFPGLRWAQPLGAA